MRKKEFQLLAVLALIAGGIIALSLWSESKQQAGRTAEDTTPAARSEASRTDSPAERRQTVAADELDELLESLVRSPESDTRAREDRRASAEEDLFSSLLRSGRSTARAESPLAAPPGKSTDDKLAETAPEEIPLQGPAAETAERESGTTDSAVVHTVQRGDTLSEISQHYYGTSTKWRDILDANKNVLSSAQNLRPNMSLVIPNVREVQISSDEKTTPETPVLNAETQSSSPAKKYTVQTGDTLWSISVKHYGSGQRHRQILSANKDVISNPGDLKVGMELVIPK